MRVSKLGIIIAVIIIIFFLIALGLGLASASLPRWISYRGTHTAYIKDRGLGIYDKDVTFGYHTRMGLFRRCITSLEYERPGQCWLHDQGELRSFYDENHREPCYVCKYLFVVGIGVGAVFGLTLACACLCVAGVAIRVFVMLSGLAAACLQTAAVVLWAMYWETKPVRDRQYGMSYWFGVGAAIAHLLAAIFAAWALFEACKLRRREPTEVVVGTVYTATMKETKVVNGREDETATRLLIYPSD